MVSEFLLSGLTSKGTRRLWTVSSVREFHTVEGDPFNPREIRESASRIRALNFFSVAEVNSREGSTSEQVIIDVDVEEAPTGSLSLGASYSADQGACIGDRFFRAKLPWSRSIAVF